MHTYCDRCVICEAPFKLLCSSSPTLPPPPLGPSHTPHLCVSSCMRSIAAQVIFSFHCVCAGTLLVKDGSHSSHEDFFQNATVLNEEQKQKTEDFYKFQDQERDYFQKFENKALSAKAGSLFLWDSRCAHQNLLPGTTGCMHGKHPCMKITCRAVLQWIFGLAPSPNIAFTMLTWGYTCYCKKSFVFHGRPVCIPLPFHKFAPPVPLPPPV